MATKCQPILLIHGGAGDISEKMVPGKLNGMKNAVRAAFPLLESTSSKTPSLDAVEEAVKVMELDASFNAGYGACLNLDGNIELEASIMEGSELRAGCVTLLHDIMHPISVARKVMEKTNHSFLGGVSAQEFALKQGFEELPAGSLVTLSAQTALSEFKKRQEKGLDTKFARTELPTTEERPGEPGTVGAVAIDAQGNIAVATSTGGITGKIAGRIGDTPILGCGTYADNTIGGVSTTGHGETIMRFNLAQRILSYIRSEGLTAQKATERACQEMTKRLTGTGGAITIDSKGELGIYWTSKRMAWAYVCDQQLYSGTDHGIIHQEPL